MSRLEILGAGGGEVTGSAFKLTTRSEDSVLIDCGLRQGEPENARFDARNRGIPGLDSKKRLKAIMITHGHLDHVGMLPSLASMTDTPIYMTEPTFDLAQIILRDAERISPWLYPVGSVNAVLARTIPVQYNSPFAVDGVTCTFKDAGHILGSSTLTIKEKGGDTIVFSGDLGNDSPSRLVKPTEMNEGADIVVMETTYGDRLHSEDSPVEVIEDAVEQAKRSNGTLLIPAFAIHRTQVVLNILKQLYRDNKLLGVPVLLDAPMGSAVTDVYDKYLPLLNEQVREKADPFDFKGLKRVKSFEESRGIKNHYKGAKIIIAGSGMMTGGRILYHAQEHLRDPKSVILFVGFAAEGTPARRIMDGEKYVEVEDTQISVNGTVLKTSSMSAHADQKQLLNYAEYTMEGNRRTREFVLIHGNDKARDAFEEKLLELGTGVIKPGIGEVIDFDQNEH